MFAVALACLITFVVGIFGGLTGVGGVLLIPAMIEILKMDTHTATATVFASFMFSGSFSAWLYSRRGQFAWGTAIPLCAGGTIFSYLGAMLKAQSSNQLIILVLSSLIVFAGVSVLKPLKAGALNLGEARKNVRLAFLFALGSLVGFLGGLAGAGGAVLIVPIMVACGFPVAVTVSASLVFSLPSGISGSIANAMNGYVDYAALLWIAVFQMGGNLIGVNLSGRMPVTKLKIVIAVLCIGTGIFLLLRNFVF